MLVCMQCFGFLLNKELLVHLFKVIQETVSNVMCDSTAPYGSSEQSCLFWTVQSRRMGNREEKVQGKQKAHLVESKYKFSFYQLQCVCVGVFSVLDSYLSIHAGCLCNYHLPYCIYQLSSDWSHTSCVQISLYCWSKIVGEWERRKRASKSTVLFI